METLQGYNNWIPHLDQIFFVEVCNIESILQGLVDKGWWVVSRHRLLQEQSFGQNLLRAKPAGGQFPLHGSQDLKYHFSSPPQIPWMTWCIVKGGFDRNNCSAWWGSLRMWGESADFSALICFVAFLHRGLLGGWEQWRISGSAEARSVDIEFKWRGLNTMLVTVTRYRLLANYF